VRPKYPLVDLHIYLEMLYKSPIRSILKAFRERIQSQVSPKQKLCKFIPQFQLVILYLVFEDVGEVWSLSAPKFHLSPMQGIFYPLNVIFMPEEQHEEAAEVPSQILGMAHFIFLGVIAFSNHVGDPQKIHLEESFLTTKLWNFITVAIADSEAAFAFAVVNRSKHN
jgi:hypothetical protein